MQPPFNVHKSVCVYVNIESKRACTLSNYRNADLHGVCMHINECICITTSAFLGSLCIYALMQKLCGTRFFFI